MQDAKMPPLAFAAKTLGCYIFYYYIRRRDLAVMRTVYRHGVTQCKSVIISHAAHLRGGLLPTSSLHAMTR